MELVDIAWLGRRPYREALRLQRARRRAVLEGRARDTLWLLEHPSVLTLGRRGGLDEEVPGLEVVATERGGLATWHGPGQLVGYLIADVGRLGHGVRSTVCGLEKGLIRWLADQGVRAHRRDGYPGVWVDDRKIASLGLHFRRGVSLHGFAINLCPDLSNFGRFTPCGIAGVQMTSLQAETSRTLAPVDAWENVATSVVRALDHERNAPSFSACDP
jgi:lipoate-protein ligase B